MRKPSASLALIGSLLLTLLLAGCGGSSAPNITITLSPATSQTIDQGQIVNIGATLTNDTSNKGVTWSLSGVGTLTGQTANTVTYQAPTSVSSSQSVTVTATAVANTAVFTTLSIAVNPPPSITSTTLPAGIAGTAYSESLTEAGGTAPFTWGVIAGSLPPGITLNTSSGILSGTPTGSGTFQFTVQISDAASFSATQTLSLSIAPPAALAISTTSLPNGALNTGYSVNLVATGGVGPYTWSITAGSLPSGLSLSSSGLISGTPSATGTSSFTARVTDSETPTAASLTQALAIIVNRVPFSITTTAVPNGTESIPYGTQLAVSGGLAPYDWTVASGSLPNGLTLSSSGVISGTPTATGTSTFTVQVTDSGTPAALALQQLSLTINPTQNSLLTGQYAFLLGGYDGGMAGSFTANGTGTITGGVEDVEASSRSLSGSNVAISSGTYAVGSDDRGVLTFTDASGNTFHFNLAVGPISSGKASIGVMTETDATTANFSGTLAQQDSSAFATSAMTGGYAFGLSGWDASAQPDVTVGSATVTSGAVSNGLYDENDAGTLSASQSFTGTLNVASNGRGTLTASLAHSTFTLYVVSSTEWFAIGSDSTTGAVRIGVVEQQGPPPYTTASITGDMVYQSQSSTSGPAPDTQVGLLSSTATSGTASLAYDEDAGGTITANNSATLTETFNNDSSGRFTLAPQTGSGFSDTIVGYMIGSDLAFVEGTGSSPSFGMFEPQAPNQTFTNASLDGSLLFGTQPLVSPPSAAQAPVASSGILTFNGTGGLSGTMDSVQGGVVTTSQINGTYVVSSNGRGTLAPNAAIFYVVTTGKLVIMSVEQTGFPNPFLEIALR